MSRLNAVDAILHHLDGCDELGIVVEKVVVSEELHREMVDRIRRDESYATGVFTRAPVYSRDVLINGIPVELKKPPLTELEQLRARVAHLEEREGVRHES